MKIKKTEWLYDEYNHPGVDHSDVEYASQYDNKMQKFRNYEKEVEKYVELLGIKEKHTIIDMGAGTGAFCIPCSKFCRKIYAVDTSTAMLSIAKEKARASAIENIEFIHAGYLTYSHSNPPVDFVISRAVLHHLPDFWKMVALMNVYEMMEKGGVLLLSGVFYSFSVKDYEQELNKVVSDIRDKVDDDFAQEAVLHIKEEFSTFNWIIEEMLERVGCSIKKKIIKSNTNVDYICEKRT